MLAIKLQRIGKKHQPSYRLIVAEKRSKMLAPPVEDLGPYNPTTKTASLNMERAAYWLKVGAQPTPTVHNLLVKEGILSVPKVAIKIKAKAKKEEEAPVAAPATATAENPPAETAEPAAEETKPAEEAPA